MWWKPRLAVLLGLLLLVGHVTATEDEDEEREEEEDEEEDDTDGPRLRVDESRVVVQSEKKLMLTCVYDGDDIGDASDLQWFNPAGKRIDGESSPSVFTVALNEHGTGHKKKTLHFPHVNERDAGTYTCKVTNQHGRVQTEEVEVNVLEAITWKETAEKAGALVGEPLIINCEAEGNPEPDITITDEDGQPLDEQRYTIAGNTVTIQSVDKSYDGDVVKCMASQAEEKYDTTATDERNVHIDVWYAPEFAENAVERYAIFERPAAIHCNVSASNPPATHFQFFRDNNQIQGGDDGYELIIDIDNLDEDDFGEYRCEVNNGKARSHQIIHLKEAKAPDEVKATFVEAKQKSIIWRLEEDNDRGELPVHAFSIQYIRKSVLHPETDIDGSDAEEDPANLEHIWRNKAISTTRSKAPSGTYEISGLRQKTDYVFRFRAVNEAGEGDVVEATAATASDRELEDSSSGDLLSLSASLLFVLLQFVIRV